MKKSLGLGELLYVDDLPIITATYGYTRRDFEPTYDELGAQNLPVEIRAFPSVQKAAAQRLGKMDLVGTIPILAREGEHEGIFMSLQPDRVIEWLELNQIKLSEPHLPAIARILAALEPIDRDRYYDSIWQLPVRRMVFGLIHSLSHAAMRAMTRYAGVDRTSVAEYIFLPLLGCVVYDSSSSFKLGGVATLVRDHLAAFLRNIADDSVECLYDPDCSDHAGACHGCLHSPEISCRVFNHGLSRAFLLGGHAPWADVCGRRADRRLLGDAGPQQMRVYVVTVNAYPWLLPPIEEALMKSDAAARGDVSKLVRNLRAPGGRPISDDEALVAFNALCDLGVLERDGSRYILNKERFAATEDLRGGVHAAVEILREQ